MGNQKYIYYSRVLFIVEFYCKTFKLGDGYRPPPGGGRYSLIRHEWRRADSQGMLFGIFVLNRVSILSFLVLIRVSILSRAIIPIMALDFINFCLKQGVFS